jgi:hypothetical protein
MALELSESNSEFRDYCVFNSETFFSHPMIRTKDTVISEFGIGFGKLQCHVCGNEL